MGVLEDEDHIKRVVKNIEMGIEKWMDDLPLDEHDEMVHALNNIPSMKSIPNRHAEAGTVISRYRGKLLDTTILISPTSENLHYEIVDLFLTATPRCLIAYGGFVSEGNADWILQDGIFSYNNFHQILQDSKVIAALSEHNSKITISCAKLGLWADTEGISKSVLTLTTDTKISLKVMDPQAVSMNGGGDHQADTEQKKQSGDIEEFSSFLEEGIGNEIGGIFNTLKPPLQEGFLKIRNPCLYIFPGGNGDSAFFAVNGFNMLVNGGACTKPWFWKLIQHVDRVDSVLATHLGSDNLPGLNSLLLRKLQEKQVKLPMDNTTPEYQELRRCLISPDLGPLFINTPTKFMEIISKSGSSSSSPKANGKVNGGLSSLLAESDENNLNHPVQKTVDIVKDTLRLSKALHMEVVPLVRKPGNPEPITLFSKVGLGRLEMYVISPAENSKELAYVNEKWGCNGKTTTPTGKTGVSNEAGNEGDSSVTNLSSISCLLVWHPFNPNEKIVRVLFPGNASQTKIFEGLETMRNLPFLKTQFATKNSLNKQKAAPAKSNGTHSATQRATARATSATTTTKKAASAPPTRKPVAPTKKEPVASKPAEKKPRPERPTSVKTKSTPTAAKTSTSTTASKTTSSATTSKSATQRDIPPAKASKTDAGPATSNKTSSAGNVKKASTSRTGVSAVQSRSETKRTGSASSARPAAPKAKTQTTTTKAQEKPKKPQALTPSKQKVDSQKSAAKSTPRKSPKPATGKKVASKNASDKPQKVEKPVAKKIPVTPPEDLTPEFSKQKEEDAIPPPTKPAELLSTGSEEPTSSVLSGRHSPEGEDGLAVQYAESPTVVQDEKNDKSDLDDGNIVIHQLATQESEDTGFIIMNKPEISEESDFISDNGSLAGTQQQPSPSVEVATNENLLSTDDKHVEDGFISSDKSTTPEDGTTKPEKAIAFADTDEEENASHKPVERMPTPFHSLQESSGETNENSPISESEGTAGTEVDIKQDIVVEDPGDNQDEVVVQWSTDSNMQMAQEEEESSVQAVEEEEKYVSENLKEEEEDRQNEFIQVEAPVPPTIQDTNVMEQPKDMGSEVHSSFNSSMEGSYELYHTGRSPPPPSDRQETIAETISDFKHEGNFEAKDFEDPSTCLDTQPQQVDLLEDPTMSMEAPDLRFSMSTTSTGSQFARMDPPFSSSDAGMTNEMISNNEQGPVPQQQQQLDPAEPDVDQKEYADEDEDKIEAEDYNKKKKVEIIQSPADIQEENLGYDNIKYQEDDKPEEDFKKEEKLEVDNTREDEVQYKDDIQEQNSNYDRDYQEEAVEEFKQSENMDVGQMRKGEDMHDVEKENSQGDIAFPQDTGAASPQDVWFEEKGVLEQEKYDSDDENGKIENNFHSHQFEEEFVKKQQEEQDEEDSYEIEQTRDVDNIQDVRLEDHLQTHESDPFGKENQDQLLDFGFDSSKPEDEEDIRMEGNQELEQVEADQQKISAAEADGSLASSAQDQGEQYYDEYSEETSLTETGATPDVEQPPVGFEYDGPNIQDYEKVEGDVISKSDLSLSSPEENFPLHGGATSDQYGLEVNGHVEMKETEEDHNDNVLVDSSQQPVSSPPRYHPAYIDPTAPLADPEDIQVDQLKPVDFGMPLDTADNQVKTPELGSPLDVNAKPFVPKSSVPIDQSPEAQFGHEEALTAGDGFNASAPTSSAVTNPFLVDMMSSNQPDPFSADIPCMPPMRGPDPCAAQDNKNTKVHPRKANSAAQAKKPTAGSSSPIYVDLTYVPNHANKNSVGIDFFKKIRSKYYVVSGNDQTKDEPSADVLNHLLEGKKSWFNDSSSHASDTEDTNVTVIPTHDTSAVREWYKQNFKELESCNIHMVASGSKVLVQVESIEACKIEF